jgi:hypothetical protein
MHTSVEDCTFFSRQLRSQLVTIKTDYIIEQLNFQRVYTFIDNTWNILIINKKKRKLYWNFCKVCLLMLWVCYHIGFYGVEVLDTMYPPERSGGQPPAKA